MFSGKTQLLIVSEKRRGRTLQNQLEAAGFYVVVKQTTLAGISFAEKAHPNLVMVGSPLRDGTVFDVCRQLRQHIRYYVPIIVYVEHGDEYDHILTLDAGADDYIAGLIKPREIAARIRAQLRRAYEYSASGSDVLDAGDLVIDCSRGQVFCGQRALDLTPIEFRMLRLLAQHRGQVLSREQILNHVWGYGLQPYGEQMVNVHICRLRRKVEIDPLNPALILTVRGLGYRLVSNPNCVYGSAARLRGDSRQNGMCQALWTTRDEKLLNNTCD